MNETEQGGGNLESNNDILFEMSGFIVPGHCGSDQLLEALTEVTITTSSRWLISLNGGF